MLKILLVVGGVWFSLAFLFVVALAAAGAKSIPSTATVKAAGAVTDPEPQAAGADSTARPPRRKIRRPLLEPADA